MHQEQETNSRLELRAEIDEVLSKADQYAFNLQREDGHWCGEFATGPFATAEHVFFRQSTGMDMSEVRDGFLKYFLSEQRSDGSWSVAPDHPSDVSTSSEVYLALRLLGVDGESEQLRAARSYILENGGLARIRVLTSIFFAQFGLVPWDAVPCLPAELALLPKMSPFNIYTFWGPARSTIMPLLIIRHHEPIYALPEGVYDDMNRLWLDPNNRSIKTGRPYSDIWRSDPVALALKLADDFLFLTKGFLGRLPLRYAARKRVLSWLLEHQSSDGTWFGFLTAYQFTVQALLLEGFTTHDDRIRKALSAMAKWLWKDDHSTRMQLSNSPAWDTAMMIKAFCLDGQYLDDKRIQSATDWCKNQQIFTKSDLNEYIPDLPTGGFAFEYNNPWYPDVDDTAATALAFYDQDQDAFLKYPLIKASEFVLAMQNADGGWAAFDRDRNPSWMHKSPFNDLDNLCDPSTADITGRCLELCGLIIRVSRNAKRAPPPDLVQRARECARRAIPYLDKEQGSDGAWWGRWGINYVFGTCNAIGGLAEFVQTDSDTTGNISSMIQRGAAFLLKTQHSDGGWGETYATYNNEPSVPPGTGSSLPTTTAWALIGLLAAGLPTTDPTLQRGIVWLCRSQNVADGNNGFSWTERQHTGVGFPRKLYIGYKLYQHLFPMMALRRYRRVEDSRIRG